VLAIGYAALAVAVLAAYTRPARGYELDIYRATPIAFWIGVGIAVLASLAVSVRHRIGRRLRTTALGLVVLAVLAVVALPLFRNYYFFGPGDSLSHLGWTRMISRGDLSPFGLLYPAIHSTAVFVNRVIGVSLRRAMLLVVLVYTLVYLVFVPRCVDEIASSRLAIVTGTFVAVLFLPINNVSVYVLPYPTTQALFFIPFVLYLAIKYIVLPDEGMPRPITAAGILLAISSVAIVLLHPQQAGSVLLVFGGIVAVQVLSRVFDPDNTISEQRPLYAQTAFLAAAFLLWAPRFGRVRSAGAGLINGLLGFGDPVGDEISRRSGSLVELGGSVPELFVKLFGVSVLLSVIAGLVVLASLINRLDGNPWKNAVVRYLTVGLVLLSGTFVVFFVGSVSVLPFRYLGAVMVVVTIVGGVGLADWPGLPDRLSLRFPPRSARPEIKTVAVLVFALLLGLQMLHVHEGAYIYQASDQVTERTMVGYENSFEHRDPAVWYAGIRGGPRRYVDAVYGTSSNETTPGGQVFEGKEQDIPFGVWGNNVSQFFGRDRYVAVTDADVQRELVLYDGIRYSRAGFLKLRSTPRIHRIRSNGDFRLYYVDENE